MFDSLEEKGLFTFYREQSHPSDPSLTTTPDTKRPSLPHKSIDPVIIKDPHSSQTKIGHKKMPSAKLYASKEVLMKPKKIMLAKILSDKDHEKDRSK